MSVQTLRIGRVASEAGVSPDTLRYYEKMGLLSEVPRTESGYREYSEKTIEQVRFIRNALRFGFGLQEVGKFLRARESGHPPCREVRAAAGKILTRVDRQIRELQVARRAIRETLADWDLRLLKTAQGQPAGLLRDLKAEHLPNDSLSVRLKKNKSR